MQDTKQKIRVGITHGDINGISYEIIIKTFQDNRISEFCTPILYGSPKVAAYHRKAMKINNSNFIQIRHAEEANLKRPNIINCLSDDVRVELGKSTRLAGNASFVALERAVDDLKAGKIDVLLTAPINKANIHSEEFNFAGHTEYLGNRFEVEEPLMLMISKTLKVGTLTGHIPIAEVAKEITIDNIISKLRLFNKSLLEDFGIRKPTIAVLGLNPHAGDNGLLGSEEIQTIIPALEQARKEGIMALGPYPSDGFFANSAYQKFDAILAMYHDQGLIPFKALSFDSGVNFTAGLPIVRTSPVHGTAYDLVGKNEAKPDSFREALYWAIDIFKKRQEFAELTENVLEVDTKPKARPTNRINKKRS